MKYILTFLLCLLTSLSFANDGMGNFPKNTNIFADKLLNQEIGKGENFVISPLSLNMAVSLVSNGAKGDTLQEFAKILQNGPFADTFGKYDRNFSSYSQKDMNVFNRNLLANSKRLGAEKYYIANGVWIRSPYTKEFYLTCKNYYNADVKPLNQNSAKDINNFVSEKTHGKIKKMIDRIDPNDRAYLVNSVYFYSAWKKEFSRHDTFLKHPFNRENGKTSQCDYMTDTDCYKVINYKDGQILIKELKGYAAMYFILPPEDAKLADFAQKINFSEIITNDTEGEDIWKITVPRFSMEYEEDFRNVFVRMGMKKAFSPNADFSRLDRTDNSYISSVLHKATIGIDEKGCEASAATAVRMMAKSAPPKKINMIVFNRPFIFAVIDELDNTVIFEGAYFGE